MGYSNLQDGVSTTVGFWKTVVDRSADPTRKTRVLWKQSDMSSPIDFTTNIYMLSHFHSFDLVPNVKISMNKIARSTVLACATLAALISISTMLGCSGVQAVDQAVIAEQILLQSYAARYELGSISNVIVKNEKDDGVSFAVTGSKQNATFVTIGKLTPNTIPICSIILEDGRQIPLFQEFLEESYKRDLESE